MNDVDIHEHNWRIQKELTVTKGNAIPVEYIYGYRYFCTKCLKTKDVKDEKN